MEMTREEFLQGQANLDALIVSAIKTAPTGSLGRPWSDPESNPLGDLKISMDIFKWIAVPGGEFWTVLGRVCL